MSKLQSIGACICAIVSVLVPVAPAQADPRPCADPRSRVGLPVTGQVVLAEYDAATQVRLVVTAQGTRFRFDARAPRLRILKTICRDGRARLELDAGKDRLQVDVTLGGVTINRNGRRVRMEGHRASTVDQGRVRAMLNGSEAVAALLEMAHAARFQRATVIGETMMEAQAMIEALIQPRRGSVPIAWEWHAGAQEPTR